MTDFGGSSKKNKTSNIVESSAPYGPAQPGINRGLEDAFNLYKSGGLNFEDFPVSTVAPTSQETQRSWQMLADQAGQNAPGVRAATDYDTRILSGDYSALNPVLSSARDAINSNKSLSGRYGSDVHDRAITEGLGTIMSNAASGAANRAPGLAQAGFLPGQILGGVGSQVEAQGQDQLNDLVRKFRYQQEEPANAIQRLLELNSGNWGGSSYSKQPVARSQSFNPWATGLGVGTSLLGSYLGGS